MSSYCDPKRSPCTGLLDSLGRWVFYDLDTGSYVATTKPYKTRHIEQVAIHYCPFCGMRLEKLCMALGEVIDFPTGHKRG